MMERKGIRKPLRIINSVAPIRICDNGGWTDTWFAGYGSIFNIGVYPYAEVQIADPAVGSGSFLLGLLRHMADWKEADEGEGAVGPFITEAAKRLYGFELTTAP